MKTKDEDLHFRQHFDVAMEKFLTNYTGHLLKSVKRMKRCANGNKNMIDPFVYENFSLTGLQCLNAYELKRMYYQIRVYTLRIHIAV
jgi:hypothetical protein